MACHALVTVLVCCIFVEERQIEQGQLELLNVYKPCLVHLGEDLTEKDTSISILQGSGTVPGSTTFT